MSNPEDFIAETCPEALLQDVCKALRADRDALRDAQKPGATEAPTLATALCLAREAGAWEPGSLPSDWDKQDLVFSPAQLVCFARLMAAEVRAGLAAVVIRGEAEGRVAEAQTDAAELARLRTECERLRAAASQASFCLRTLAPDDADARMTVCMLHGALGRPNVQAQRPV